MIVTDGGRFGGYGLFLSKGELGIGRGKVVFLYNLLDLKRTPGKGPELEAGKHTIVFDFKSDGPGFGKGGTGVLSVDGKEVARNSLEHTTPDHVPGGRDLRRRPGHSHPASRSSSIATTAVQVHRQDQQADLQARAAAGSETLATADAFEPADETIRTTCVGLSSCVRIGGHSPHQRFVGRNTPKVFRYEVDARLPAT